MCFAVERLPNFLPEQRFIQEIKKTQLFVQLGFFDGSNGGAVLERSNCFFQEVKNMV